MTGLWDMFHRWYRGTLYQAVILGLISFTQPGIWDALNGLGAGGLATPYFVNASNVITYVIMIVTCPIFAIAGNRFSLKWVLVAGTLGYVPYFAALYCNSVFGTQWFLLLGSVTCGFSAAALWVSEAAIAVGYPEIENRGTYIGIWMALNKLGSIIGNSIQLALNINNDHKGSISPRTYLVLIGLSCAGLPLALTIAPADKLIRKDGTKPTFSSTESKITLKEGLKGFWKATKQKYMLLLIPIFMTVRWSQTYQGNYLTEYFSVRGRTLAGFIQTVVGIVATILWGWLLDSKMLMKTKRRMAIVGWLAMLAVFVPQWVLNFVMQARLQGQSPTPSLDIHDPDYGKAIAAYCLFGVGSQASVVWTYWILGTYDIHVDVLAYTTGILRSVESLGFAIAFGIGASENVSLMTNLIVAFVVFWVSVPFTTYASCLVQESPGDSCPEGDLTTKVPTVTEEARDGRDV
ncbi:major facilitator superfamily domain-containing protein [Aspergillus avenaceus]|uniref:Major facilitator superfamily domain-containing protein n=1 Tax=Aspergillus avenaceus TaxID=36643 RepID=A0A5N6TFU7_ASPAV|nr:major facilitator superfamily domain-containing protein [Aspergillus avenaceus]